MGELGGVSGDALTQAAEEVRDVPDLAPDDAAGRRIDRFIVLERLGVGGMGEVFAAYDGRLDRKVAVKVLHRRRVPTPEAQARMLREARVLARLSHPNVVSVFDGGTHDDQVYIAMEFVRGHTLRQWLADEPHTWAEIVEVFAALAEGLEAMHELGLVHRDFKPDNVIVDERGRPRLIDFGLARPVGAKDPPEEEDPEHDQAIDDLRLTSTGAVLGTPRYMSPEQIEMREVGAASDQFAFCVALFEAIYDEQPFRGDTVASRAVAVLGSPPRTPTDPGRAPSGLLELLHRGMKRRPQDRHPSMLELADALRRLLAVYGATLDDIGHQRQRQRVLLAILALAVLGPGLVSLATATGWLTLQPYHLVIVDLVLLGGVALAMATLRASWRGHKVGRRMAGYLVLMATLFTGQDLAGLLAGRSVADSVLANLVALSVVSIFAARLVTPVLRAVAAWAAVTTVGAALDPPHAWWYFNAAVAGGALLAAVLAPRRGRKSWAVPAATTGD